MDSADPFIVRRSGRPGTDKKYEAYGCPHSQIGSAGEHPHRPRVRSSGAPDAPCRSLEGPRGAMGDRRKLTFRFAYVSPLRKDLVKRTVATRQQDPYTPYGREPKSRYHAGE